MEKATMIIDQLAQHNFDDGIYLVGGGVRDYLLGRPVHDVDLAVPGDSRVWADQIAQALHGSVVMVGESYNIHRVAVGNQIVADVAGFDDTIEADLQRRDFTVNALAMPLSEWTGGRGVIGDVQDLYAGELRPVGDSIFTEDAVRMLRAIRQARQLGFRLHEDTLALLRRDAPLLNNSAPERISSEFLHILSLDEALLSIMTLDEYGLLAQIIPELEAGRGMAQPPEWHEHDVLWHQFYAMHFAEKLTSADGFRGAGDYSQYFDQLVGEGQTRRTLLKLTALIHDLGKPDTFSVSDTIHFYGHEDVGAELVRERLQALKMGSQNVELVENMVRHHLRPHIVAAPRTSARAIHRFCRDLGAEVTDCFFLAMSDGWASSETRYGRVWDEVLAGRERVFQLKEQPVNKPNAGCSFINGHELMAELALSPGPVIGKIITELREAEAAGEIRSKAEALNWAQVWIGVK